MNHVQFHSRGNEHEVTELLKISERGIEMEWATITMLTNSAGDGDKELMALAHIAVT